jgi:hypothetical protein
MKRVITLVLGIASVAASLPAAAAWEELRRNDEQRLSIDTDSIRKRGDEVSFRYLVDFRRVQGDLKTVEYRSLTVKAAIRCKARRIALRETEVFAGPEAQGPAAGIMKPGRDEARFKKIEQHTSDEELYARVCKAAPAKAAPGKAAAPAKK